MPEEYQEAKESLKISYQMLEHISNQGTTNKDFVKNHIIVVESMLETLLTLKDKLSTVLKKMDD